MLKLLKFTTFLAVIFIQITILQCISGQLQHSECDGENQVNKTLKELKASFGKFLEKGSKSVQELRDRWIEDLEDKKPLYRNCVEVLHNGGTQSGVYEIQPTFWKLPINVYCDMKTDGGGWLVFQRRVNIQPREDFYRSWDDYKKGFGNLEGEFWLGNDVIFALTNQEKTKFRVDLEDYENNTRFAIYDYFIIRAELDNYRLQLGAYSEGNAGDGLTAKSNGQAFSTKDRKNDLLPPEKSCAHSYIGAWWFGSCHDAHLNGYQFVGKHETFGDGINWDPFKGEHYSLKFTEMKLRPSSFQYA